MLNYSMLKNEDIYNFYDNETKDNKAVIPPKILVVDNEDSFVYNIVEMLRQEKVDIRIIKEKNLKDSDTDGINAIILSPGPDTPEQFPNMMKLLHSSELPILGICLGHQAIAINAQCSINQLDRPKHGFSSQLRIIKNHPIFHNIQESSPIARYHSWIINKISNDIEVLAVDEDNNIMAIAHKTRKQIGLQFHPESIISTEGKKLIHNWIKSL